MKPKYLIGALAFLALACSVDTNSVNLIGTQAVDATCTAQANMFVERGLVDLSVSPQYLLGVNYSNTAGTQASSVNGQTLQTYNNNFIGQQVVYDYTSDPAASWAEETEQRSFSMVQGANGGSQNWILVPLIQPKALAQLQSMTIPATGITLNVTFQVKGNWENGGSGSTNKFTFPVTVVNSGFTGCAADKVEVGNQVCGNFQDGPVSCADAGT